MSSSFLLYIIEKEKRNNYFQFVLCKNNREWDKEISMIITNASDINKVLLQLQKQIQQLERRIKVLENM